MRAHNLENMMIINRLEKHGFEFSRWPKRSVPVCARDLVHERRPDFGSGKDRAADKATLNWLGALGGQYGETVRPVLITRWGFVVGDHERNKKGQGGETRLTFYALTDRLDDMPRVKARCMAAIWRELAQISMLQAGIAVEQGDPAGIFGLSVEFNSAVEQGEVQGALLEFLTVLFVADRIGQIIEEAAGTTRLVDSGKRHPSAARTPMVVFDSQ